MQNIDARFIEAIKNHFTKRGNLDIVKLDTAEVVNTYNLSKKPFNALPFSVRANLEVSWNRVSSLISGGLYLVGGAVRDTIMGLPSSDSDYVVTGQTPESMIKMGFEQVGADFPVFLHPITSEEYALARIERKVGTGYHGFETDFSVTTTIEDDLFRRDLTINAIACNVITDEFIDPFNGIVDIDTGIIRCVNPSSFKEDPLRVLRAIRFACRYDHMTVDTDTLSVMQEMVDAGMLDELPYERFVAELKKVYSDIGHSQSKVYKFWDLISGFDMHTKVKFFEELGGVGLLAGAKIITNSFHNTDKIKDFLPGIPKDIPYHEVLLTLTLAHGVSYVAFFIDDRGGVTVRNIVGRFFPKANAVGKFVYSLLAEMAKAQDVMKHGTDIRPLAAIAVSVIQKHRLLQEDNADTVWYIDLLNCCAGGLTTKPQSSFANSVRLLNAVKSEQFPHLSGKELGAAILNERVDVLTAHLTAFVGN